jgi:hypothetical protein
MKGALLILVFGVASLFDALMTLLGLALMVKAAGPFDYVLSAITGF